MVGELCRRVGLSQNISELRFVAGFPGLVKLILILFFVICLATVTYCRCRVINLVLAVAVVVRRILLGLRSGLGA